MKDNKTLTLFGQEASAENALYLKNEDDAWSLLKSLQDANYGIPNDIVIGDWCKLHLYLRGEKWNSSITPSLFPLFEKLQKIVYRIYAQALYKDKNKRLTKDEKEKLEIVIHVCSGSSNNSAKLNLTELAKACVEKMDGKDVFKIVTIVAIAVSSYSIFKVHSDNVREIRIAETQNEETKKMLEAFKFASEQDKEKTALFLDVIRKDDTASFLEDDINELHNAMLKSATKADESKINGLSLEKDVAVELVKPTLSKPTPMQINGIFTILNLDWGTPHHITLKRLDDGIVLKAEFDLDWLSDEAKSIIQSTEWKESGEKVFFAKINARVTKDNKIKNAQLISVSEKDAN